MTARYLPQFPPHSGFHASLRAAVEAEVAMIARPRDAGALYVKIAILAAFHRVLRRLSLDLRTGRDAARSAIRFAAGVDRLQRGTRRRSRVAVALALHRSLRRLLLRPPRRQLLRLALEAQSLSPLLSEHRRRRQRLRARADRTSRALPPPALDSSLSTHLSLDGVRAGVDQVAFPRRHPRRAVRTHRSHASAASARYGAAAVHCSH